MLIAHELKRILTVAFAEDVPAGDVTSEVFVPASARLRAEACAREDGIMAGGDVFAAALRWFDESISIELPIADGVAFAAGETLAIVEGPARAVLGAERVGLNLLQRLTAIAALTRRYVDAVAHTDARITDTRKTTPGLRMLERHAVRCGGGFNHRENLSAAVMAKDNHLSLIGDIAAAVRHARAQLPHTTHIEVEVDTLEQLQTLMEEPPDTVMLDNFSLDDLREGVEFVAGRCLVEASGGVNLETVGAIAETGVDLVSVGALTHSVRHLDIGLDAKVTA